MARRAVGLLILLAGLSSPATAQLRPVVIRVAGLAGLDSLARLGFEVAGARPVAGGLEAVVVASPETERLLAGAGLRAAPVPGAPPAGPAGDTFTVFRSFDKPATGIRATLAAWAASDSLIHVDSIGASVEGRPMLAVKIGTAGDDPLHPNVLFIGTHHAREWISTEMAMRLIRWLADSLARSLLATRDIWVIPVENPDGYQYTFTTDRYWRKNRRPNADGSFGVDLNRNYPAFWGYDNAGSSGVTITEIYRGTGPSSEPETQAIVAFHAVHPPTTAISYHSYGDVILHPYGFRAGALPPDLPVYDALGGTDLAPAVRDGLPGTVISHYHPGPGWNLYPTNGEYTDWAYRAQGTMAVTAELTSGCCTLSAGVYYGFLFPDDSVLVEQVFRDNLPLALAAIVSAGDVQSAQGPAGQTPAPPRVESIWPEVWVSLPASAPAPFGLTVRTVTGRIVSRSLSADSLARGVVRTLWRSDLTADTAREVRVDGGAGLAAGLVSIAGAEDADMDWVGWSRSPAALVGSWSWVATADDTLTSPTIDLSSRTRVWLQLWTKHSGSTFAPAQHGVVQVSADGGVTWADVALIVGDGPVWYPMRLDVLGLAGARAARVRFVSVGFTWWVDAVGFASDSTDAFVALPPPTAVEVSENPVRSGQVWISWPAGSGAPRLGIYTFTGERLLSTTLTPGTTEYAWDLTAGTRRVPNGAYLIIVQLDGRIARRRLFVTRP